MSFEVEGRLYKKMDVNQVTDSFRKREFVLEMEDGAYTQLIKFQLTQSNCEKLDPYNEGDQVKVTFFPAWPRIYQRWQHHLFYQSGCLAHRKCRRR